MRRIDVRMFRFVLAAIGLGTFVLASRPISPRWQVTGKSDETLPPFHFIIEPSGVIIAQEHENVSLQCIATADDEQAIRITWYKDGVALFSPRPPTALLVSPSSSSAAGGHFIESQWKRPHRRYAVERYGTLLIEDVARRQPLSASVANSRQRQSFSGDQGRYECVASHPRYGSIVSTPVHLRIAGMSGKFSILPSPEIVASAGQSLRMQCAINSTPPATITWYKNGALFPQPGSMEEKRVTVLDSLGVIQMGNVQPSDSGNYDCLAVSDVGYRRQSPITQLSVTRSSQGQRMEARLVTSLPPVIKTVLGKTVIIECFVTGQPPPLVTWNKDGVLVGREGRVRTVGNGNLQLDNVTVADEGTYVCSWSGLTSRNTAKVNLTVAVPPSPKLNDTLAPVVRCRQGQALRLHCAFDGRPLPSVQWFRNGAPFVTSDPRIHVENSDRGFANIFINATTVEQYSGRMYQCRATNVAGTSQQTTWVHIEISDDGPRPPENIVAVPHDSNSVIVTWSEVAHNVQFIVVAYNIQYRVTEAVSDPFTERVAQVGTSFVQINGLYPNTNYTIHMVTYTSRGQSKRSPPVTVVTSSAVVTSQPENALYQPRNAVSFVQKPAAGLFPLPPQSVLSTDESSSDRQNDVNGGGLTDQQIGIIIGTTIGSTCIVISIIAVLCYNRRYPVQAITVHSSEIANGPSYQGQCRCRILRDSLRDRIVIQNVQPPDVSRVQIAIENKSCDTKGGNSLSTGCNGTIKLTENPYVGCVCERLSLLSTPSERESDDVTGSESNDSQKDADSRNEFDAKVDLDDDYDF